MQYCESLATGATADPRAGRHVLQRYNQEQEESVAAVGADRDAQAGATGADGESDKRMLNIRRLYASQLRSKSARKEKQEQEKLLGGSGGPSTEDAAAKAGVTEEGKEDKQ